MPKEKKPAKPTLEELKTLAKELNAVMGLSPEVDDEIDEIDALIEEIKEYGLPYVCPQEKKKYTDRSWALALELGCKPEENEGCADVKSDASDSPPAEETPAESPENSDTPTDTGESKPASPSIQVAGAKRLGDLKSLVNELPELKKLRKNLDETYKGLEGFHKLKADCFAIVGKPEPRGPVERSGAKGGSRASAQARMEYIVKRITEGKVTRKELMDEICQKFPEATRSAVQTMLTDAKNPKYCRLPFVVEEDDKGVLHFTKVKPDSKK